MAPVSVPPYANAYQMILIFGFSRLEGKVPSAHTGRMRWKSCVFDGSGKVAPVGAAIGRPPVSLAVFCGRAMLAPTAVTLLHRPPHQSACGYQIPLKGQPLTDSIHWYSMKNTLF